MLENVLQILGVDIDESGGEDQLMTECTRKQWSSLQVCRIVPIIYLIAWHASACVHVFQLPSLCVSCDILFISVYAIT